MKSNAKDAVPTEIRRLERLIQNCRHGGPSASDQETFWFQECVRYAMPNTPLDNLIDQSFTSNDEQIRMALVMTINFLIDSRSGCQLMLGEIGSRKFFASLAVDAWFNEDYVYVRKFLIKSIVLDHIQSHGASRILAEINHPDDHNEHNKLRRYSTLERVKGVLQCHYSGLKKVLEFCTDGHCLCIAMSQMLNDEKEIFLNPNADRGGHAARRKERESARLPPILKPSSEYWVIKKKAAACLADGKLGESSRLYLQAKGVLGEHRDLNAPTHEHEWMLQIAEEIGKIASNLSMICLRKNLKHKALRYADEAVLACPGWSKSYCRRALALQALGRFEEAQLAIFNALKKISIVEDAEMKRQRKEYQKIQKEIEIELGDRKSPPVENPLYKPLNFELVRNQGGSIGLLHDNQGIRDIVYSFLEPVGVANMERTCIIFATNVERGRRIAIGNKLLSGSSRSSKLPNTTSAVENSLIKYINSIDDSSTMALQNFVSEVRPSIDGKNWKDISHVKMDPQSFKTILVSVFSNSSAGAVQDLFEMLDHLYFSSSRDFHIATYLLRGDSRSCRSLQQTVLEQMTHLLDLEDGDEYGGCFSRRFFQHSMDLEVLKLAVSLDDDYDEVGLKDTAFIILNNSVLSKGGKRKQKMDQDDPLYTHNVAFHSLYTAHIPDEWPGLIDDLFSWGTDSVEKDSIKQYWVDENPTMLRMWKVAILKCLKWVHGVEEEGCISDYLLVSRIMLGQMMIESGYSPISFYSFGSFLVMRSVEFGGAVSLSVRLRNEDDLTDLFHDYYSFLKLCRTGFPSLIEYRDRLLASHFSHLG